MLTISSQVAAECGTLCDWDWWKTATEADVQAELDGGADLMVRNKYGETPLHYAARFGNPAKIQSLLDADADVMAWDRSGETPLHYAA